MPPTRRPVTGSTPPYLTASDYTVASGSAITSTDVARHAQVVDIGSEVASNLFATGSNPIGQQITLGSSNWLVVGVLASKGTSGGSNQDAVAIAPYTAVQDQLTGESQSFTELLIQGKSSSTLTLAQSEVENILAAQNDTTVARPSFPSPERGKPGLDGDIDDQHPDLPSGGGGRHFAPRRRYRSDEHHVGECDRARPGRSVSAKPSVLRKIAILIAVPHRGGGDLTPRWRGGGGGSG